MGIAMHGATTVSLTGISCFCLQAGPVVKSLAVQVDNEGKIQYDLIARQGHAANRVVHSKFTDLVAKDVMDVDEDPTLLRPDAETVKSVADKTRAALEKIVQGARACFEAGSGTVQSSHPSTMAVALTVSFSSSSHLQAKSSPLCRKSTRSPRRRKKRSNISSTPRHNKDRPSTPGRTSESSV
jgi:hypothetical protein